MFSNFFSENRAVYEMTSKNLVASEWPQTIWRMRVACWIRKDTRAGACAPAHAHPHESTHPRALARTHTHTEVYNTYCFSTLTVVS